jgi:alpha-L-rhamnosidase
MINEKKFTANSSRSGALRSALLSVMFILPLCSLYAAEENPLGGIAEGATHPSEFNYSKAELLTVKDGAYSDPFIAESPDPMHSYRWPSPQASDDLQMYALKPVAVSATAPCSGLESLCTDKANVTIKGKGRILLDFGVESAAWLEIESPDLSGDVEFGISEYNEYAILNGIHIKKKAPVKIGPNTYRLQLSEALYEGVRFGFVHVNSFDKPWHITKARIICQTKPANYNGSFKCSDPMLTKIWYVGAYGVKLNLLKDYYGAILMDRGDRHSWTGDAHPSQAASMVAFANYDFVKHNIDRTATQFNGLKSYSLYWVLSLLDYYRYTGDTATVQHYIPNVKAKLKYALNVYGKKPRLGFYGWDDRLGAGFENSDCSENYRAYKMLTIRACREFAQALGTHSFQDTKSSLETGDYYLKKADELMQEMRKDDPDWYVDFGLHASADAICTQITNSKENQQMFLNAGFNDRLQRLSYSPFNQYWVIQALALMNRYDEAYSSILDLWGGQIQYGGTTFFETFRPAWGEMLGKNDAVPNNQSGFTSLCHPWGGGVTKWLTEEVLGIKPSSPGFKTFDVIPHLGRHLTSVEGKVSTPHGEIKASFNVITGECSIMIPEGTTGNFAIPKVEKNITAIKINGKLAWDTKSHLIPGIGAAKEDAEFVYFINVQPGTYQAVVSYAGTTPSYDAGPYVYRAPFIKLDKKTQGNWGGVYGKDGYALFNYHGNGKHQVTMPEFCKSINYHRDHHTNLTLATQDPRAPAADSSNAAARKIGCIHTNNPRACRQRFCVDIAVAGNSTYDLALYFVDWNKSGMRLSAEILDLETKELIGPTKYVEDSTNGAYLVYRVTGSCRVSVNHIRGDNATLSALFFDTVTPLKTSSFPVKNSQPKALKATDRALCRSVAAGAVPNPK